MMPFINPETVKEFRKELKKLLPEYKLSVRTSPSYTSVNVAIITAPFQMLDDPATDHENINDFYIDDLYKHNPKKIEVLKTICEVIKSKQKTMESGYDTLYNYHVHITIGRWDKPFEVVKNK